MLPRWTGGEGKAKAAPSCALGKVSSPQRAEVPEEGTLARQNAGAQGSAEALPGMMASWGFAC